MVINPLKAFLFVTCGAGAAVATAYVSGALDPYLAAAEGDKVAVATLADPAAAPKQARVGETAKAPDGSVPLPEAAEPAAPASPAIPAEPEAKPAQAPAAEPQVLAPSFDIVRVEPDGSIVVAGKAAPKSTVEIVAGSDVVGSTKVGDGGDFAIVLDEPLKPGGHELVLRSTTEDKVVATSPETAVVSIPETPDGQVLALVERPGEPSKLITVPAAQKVAPKVDAKPAEPAAEPAASQQPEAPIAQARAEPAKAGGAEKPPVQAAGVTVDAVEIEGRKVFVAGAAEPGRRVRVYANDILLGEAQAAPGGRFLIETERELPVGDYIIRADALDADGAKVIARAAVPFEREPGEALAAVAPEAVPAAPETPPTAGEPPAAEPSAAASAAGTSAPEASGSAAPSEGGAAVAAGEAPAGDVAAEPQAKLQHVDGSVIIRRGDTLWRISRRVYGRGVRYSTIYLANQDQISDPDRIWPGQVFNVPGRTPEGEPADMTAVKEQAAPADGKSADGAGPDGKVLPKTPL